MTEYSSDLPLDVPLALVQASALLTLLEDLTRDEAQPPLHRGYLAEKFVRITEGSEWWQARQALHPGLWWRFYEIVDRMSGNPDATKAQREFTRTRGLGA